MVGVSRPGHPRGQAREPHLQHRRDGVGGAGAKVVAHTLDGWGRQWQGLVRGTADVFLLHALAPSHRPGNHMRQVFGKRGKEQVRQLMQRHGIRAKGKRKFVVTTESKHHLPLAPDLVRRRFTPAARTVLWSGDITYLPTDEGWLYLAAVMDLHSRQVVGWSLQSHMQTALVKDAFLMACFRRRRPAADLIFHSNRGSQYCSQEFQQTLKAWGIRSSMSPKGNCWDNAAPREPVGTAEDCQCSWMSIHTREQARQAVMDWTPSATIRGYMRRWAISARSTSTTLVGGAALICRLMIGLCTPILSGNFMP